MGELCEDKVLELQGENGMDACSPSSVGIDTDTQVQMLLGSNT